MWGSAKISKKYTPPPLVYSEPESRLIDVTKDSMVEVLSDLFSKELLAGVGGSSLPVEV